MYYEDFCLSTKYRVCSVVTKINLGWKDTFLSIFDMNSSLSKNICIAQKCQGKNVASVLYTDFCVTALFPIVSGGNCFYNHLLKLTLLLK